MDGYNKADIRKSAWEENIYFIRSCATGIYHLRCGDRKEFELNRNFNGQRLFFKFLHEVYDKKIRLGEKKITDCDLNVFFSDKTMQSDVVGV